MFEKYQSVRVNINNHTNDVMCLFFEEKDNTISLLFNSEMIYLIEPEPHIVDIQHIERPHTADFEALNMNNKITIGISGLTDRYVGYYGGIEKFNNKEYVVVIFKEEECKLII